MNANDKKLSLSSLIVSIMLLLSGLYVFFKDSAYMEPNHYWLLLAYIAFNIAFYFFFKLWRVALATISLFTMMFVLIIIVQKYEWRKDYVNASVPFFLEEHITDYPTFEQHLYTSYFGGEDWIGFSRDCAEPSLLNKPTPLECRSFSMIQATYGLDLKNEAKLYFRKMQSTAKKIERGSMKTAQQYRVCVQSKGCAEIPMLPKGVSAENIDPNSNAYIEVRKAYWDLIDKKEITPAVCNFMKLCKVMLKLELVKPDDIKL